MAYPPMVLPDWGQSLGGGISGGFEEVAQGLIEKRKMDMMKAHLAAETMDKDMSFYEHTGYDRSRIGAGMQAFRGATPEVQAAPPNTEHPGVLDEFKTYRNDLETKRQTELKLKGEQARKMGLESDWLSGQIDDKANGGGGKPELVMGDDGFHYIRKVTKSGTGFTPAPDQKGNQGAIQLVNDALSSAENIPKYFAAVKASGSPKLAQTNMPFGVGQFAFPDVAQKESALMVPFQFSQGGKALTEVETKLISSLAKNNAWGDTERADAEKELVKLLTRRIRGQVQGNLTGPDKKRYLDSVSTLEQKYGIQPGVRLPPEQRYSELTDKLKLSKEDAYGIMHEEGYR